MEQIEIIKELNHPGGFRTIRKRSYIETFNNLNQLIHYIDLTYIKAGIFLQGWVGFQSNEQIKEILQGHFLELFAQYPCNKLLSDCSKMKSSFIEIDNWYNETNRTELIKSGLKYHAIIKPKDNFAQLTFKEWNHNNNGIKNNTFSSLGDALNWLSLL